jgi:hypothetical protein|tara:strand:+ start:512 stop:625 length:114 start_codon:yes stop_codon:yes gene_type:complete
MFFLLDYAELWHFEEKRYNKVFGEAEEFGFLLLIHTQ